jgi:hypothetical protein
MKVRCTCLLLLNPLALEKLNWQNHINQQSTTELIVSLIISNKEHLLRALAGTGASSSSIILEAYASAPFIKTDASNKTTWSTMGGKFTTTKFWKCL